MHKILDALDFARYYEQELKQTITSDKKNVNLYCPFHEEIPGQNNRYSRRRT